MHQTSPLRRGIAGIVVLCLGVAPGITKGTDPATPSVDGPWVALGEMPPPAANDPTVQPRQYRGFRLDPEALSDALDRAPKEFSAEAMSSPQTITLPTPDGGFSRFVILESSIMEPELAAKFTEIKTYIGRGIDDPAASLRCDWTPAGFHAQVLSPGGAFYIDPYRRGDVGLYVSYYKRDAGRPAKGFECLTPPSDVAGQPVPPNVALVPSGDTLRAYRLACAATGEYTFYHGGTVAAGLAAIATAVNRVTGIYETELAIRMVLVANNNLIVYTNAATDPYTNSDGVAMLGQNQSNLNTVIGTANYDIGHVFSTGGGGVAGLRVVCRTNKAQGVTGLGSPIGDPFYVDYVAHEMGHQFGGNHTFNGIDGSCSGGNRNGSTAYEPGSGSTIMAYAGICGSDDLQPNSDPYFHFVSFDEIRSYVTTGNGNACPVVTNTGNSAPAVSAGADYSIPRETPFTLTASGNDPDGDSLVFGWEQRDLGPAAALEAPDNGLIPLFRFFNPTVSPSRTFPKLSSILSNSPSTGEQLPTQNRTMDFRVTARDNEAGGGGVAADDVQVFVIASAGPFRVSFPDLTTTLFGEINVTWDVVSTDVPPVSVTSVNILLSVDGGQTFPIILASGTPNDGAEIVLLPDVFTVAGRVKVEAAGNVFFDVSNHNFTISACEELAAAQPEPAAISKSRYLSLVPSNTGIVTALRMTLTDLPPPFTSFNGQIRWVGPPQLFNEDPGSAVTYHASALQCEQYFTDWGAIGLLHVYGPEVVPGADYEFAAVQCDPSMESNFSAPLLVSTGRWADIAAPYNPPSPTTQPDALDVVGMVYKFKGLPGAPIMARADLFPRIPDHTCNALDITVCVDAFKGGSYPFAGPAVCPP